MKNARILLLALTLGLTAMVAHAQDDAAADEAVQPPQVDEADSPQVAPTNAADAPETDAAEETPAQEPATLDGETEAEAQEQPAPEPKKPAGPYRPVAAFWFVVPGR